MRLHEQLDVKSPPEAVFRWIEDPKLATRWQPEIAEYQITREVPGRVGTEFRERLKGEGGTLELRGRITAYVANALMEFDVRGRGVHVKARYTVSPTDTGARLRVDTDLRLGGPLRFFIEPFVRGKMARQVRAELERLRALCEGAGR